MLKNILILNFVYLCTALSVFCFSEEDLANIEYSKYGETYNTESIAERLNRLENDFFGMGQSGDIESRVAMLSKMTENSRRSAIINPSENYYPGEKKSAIRNFWDNVSSAFGDEGTITGFTPPVSSSGYNWGYSNNYSGNIYGKELGNYMNNPNRYCPYYHNRYNNNLFNGMFNRNKGMLNSNNKYYGTGQRPPAAPFRGNYRYPAGGQRNYYQLPPAITTKSSVQIIKD